MERGLLWLPLLAAFIGLAWAGWNEYQKLEAYKQWAQQFERTKYDIYAVLGQRDQTLTWGIPTRKGPIQIQTLTLESIHTIALTLDGQPIPSESADPNIQKPKTAKGKVALTFDLIAGVSVSIPFTDIEIAQQWETFLNTRL